MEDIVKIVGGRRSVRAFDGRGIGMDDRNKLSLFMEKIGNPYGIPVEFKLLDREKQDLSCPVVSGTDLYVGAKAPRMPHMEEAFGYRPLPFCFYGQRKCPQCSFQRERSGDYGRGRYRIYRVVFAPTAVTSHQE